MKSARVLLLFGAAGLALFSAEPYRKPPKLVLDALTAPNTPTLSLSPNRAYALQATVARYPSIAEVSQPMLRLAGQRINPKTNGLHNATSNSALAIRKIPEGVETKVDLPLGPKLGPAHWSPDSAHFAFTNAAPGGAELWIGDTATGRTRRIEGLHVNTVMGGAGGGGRGGRGGESGTSGANVQWLPDSKGLLVHMVKPNRGAPPAEPTVPTGPHVQESLGGAQPEATHEDMLQNPHDEDLWEFYTTS